MIYSFLERYKNYCLFSNNHSFDFGYNDKNSWKEVLEFGRSIGISDEQLDFLIKRIINKRL